MILTVKYNKRFKLWGLYESFEGSENLIARYATKMPAKETALGYLARGQCSQVLVEPHRGDKIRTYPNNLDKERWKRAQVKRFNRAKRRKHWVNLYKQKKGCACCGYKDDHKALCLQNMDIRTAAMSTIKTLVKQLRSAEIVCRNCLHKYLSVQKGEAR